MRDTLLVMAWDDADDPLGNVWRISDSKCDVSVREAEEVLTAQQAEDYPLTLAGLPMRVAWVTTGRWIAVVYDAIPIAADVFVVRVHYAYEVGSPQERQQWS